MSTEKKCETCGKIVDVLYGKFNKGENPDYSEIGARKVCETCADKLIESNYWAYVRLVD